jgi:hypothetical protein
VCYCIGRDCQIHSIVCSGTRPALIFSRANPCLSTDEAFGWVFSGSHTLGLPHQSFWEATQVVFEADCVVDTYPYLKENLQNHC